MVLVDSHCHLDILIQQDLHNTLDNILVEAKMCNVNYVLAVATTLQSYQTTRSLVGARKEVVYSCGIHPLNLEQNEDYSNLFRLAAEDEVVGVGETGLDYFYSKDNINLQQKSFRNHIHIGKKLNKPLIIHSRNASVDTLSILREENANECGGVLHSFNEDLKTAEVLLNLGFYISFSGIITFSNTKRLQEVVRYVPLNRILLETDSPYLAPVPYRGKINQPAYIQNIAQYVADLKRISVKDVAEKTTSNFLRLFRVKF